MLAPLGRIFPGVGAGVIASRLALLGILLCVAETTADAAGFIGSASCRACHQAAYDQWKVSPHAKAFEALPASDQKNAQCLQCHARDVNQGGEAGVSCETCHGAGQYYWPDYVMRDAEVARGAGLVSAPDPRTCVLCHDGSTPALKPFDPNTAMPAIDHWSKDRAARGVKATDACPRRDLPAPVRHVAAEPKPNERFLGRVLTGHWANKPLATSRPLTAARGVAAASAARAD
jgi:hypothetical protein